MKQLSEEQNKESLVRYPCTVGETDALVWETVWKQGYEVINHLHSNHFLQAVLVKPVESGEVENWEISKNFIKYGTFLGVFPDGKTRVIDGKTITFPKGTYTKIDESKFPNFVATLCYKNEVLTIDGITFDNMTINKNGQFQDDKLMGQITDIGDGYFRFIGFLQAEDLKQGYKSWIEYSNIQDHITENKKVFHKDATGQFIFIGNGIVTIKWGDGEHTFEKGAVIQITQDIEISSDGDFDAYEFYQVKDKSSFYNA